MCIALLLAGRPQGGFTIDVLGFDCCEVVCWSVESVVLVCWGEV